MACASVQHRSVAQESAHSLCRRARSHATVLSPHTLPSDLRATPAPRSSGKTTLVNRILTGSHGQRIAVIENEFGEVGVDDALLIRLASEELLELNNGCICCTVRGDLLRILTKLIARPERLDAVVIETTGLADPAPVAQVFFLDEEIKSAMRLDAIVTVVDAAHALSHLDETKPDGVENEAVEQVAFADRIILNKTDLVTPQQADALTRRLRAINAAAPVIRAVNADVPLTQLLGVSAFDLRRVLDFDAGFLEEGGEDHQHDPSVTSVGLTAPGALSLERVNAWLSSLLRQRGADIFRSKGVLNIAGSDARFVFQGVHMTLATGSSDDGDARPWAPGEVRANRLIFIGRNLDRAALQAAFEQCRADA